MMSSAVYHVTSAVIVCYCVQVYGMTLTKTGNDAYANEMEPQAQIVNSISDSLSYLVNRTKEAPANESDVSNSDVMCPDGRWRIHRDWLCDGFPDCEGAWDENPATCRSMRCPEGWVQCGDGLKCLRPWMACDGIDDCGDNTDESVDMCENRDCFSGFHKCQDGRQCVLLNFFCDGHIDCQDGSDEQAEVCRDVSCTSGLVRCPTGECIFRGLTCDGKPDCADGYDENPNICDYVDNLPQFNRLT